MTGGLALSASSDVKSKLGTLGVQQGDIDAAHSKMVTLGVVTDVLLGATLAAGGVSLYFTLRSPPSSSGAASLTATPRGGRFTVTF